MEGQSRGEEQSSGLVLRGAGFLELLKRYSKQAQVREAGVTKVR